MDAIERAMAMKAALDGHGMGAYTHSNGTLHQDVAHFIELRDGATPGSVDVENICLTSGASEAITMLMTAFIKDPSCGIMTQFHNTRFTVLPWICLGDRRWDTTLTRNWRGD